jgi:hypothetical protein
MQLLWTRYAITQMRGWPISNIRHHIPKMPSDKRTISFVCVGCSKRHCFSHKFHNINYILEPSLWIVELFCFQGPLNNYTYTVPFPLSMSCAKVMPTQFATWSKTWVVRYKIHSLWSLELACTSVIPNYMMQWPYTLTSKPIPLLK